MVLAIELALANGPGHGDLAGQALALQRAGEDVAVFLGNSHNFSPDKKCLLNGELLYCSGHTGVTGHLIDAGCLAPAVGGMKRVNNQV